MPERLPKWVEAGGFVLTIVAGMINAIAILGFNHQGVSHLSGVTTLIGIDFVDGRGREALQLLAMVASFAAGAAFSGLLIGGKSLVFGPRYAAALIVEGALIVCGMLLLVAHSPVGLMLMACACGLQNAITSTFSGAIVRTTHVTGIITDLGVSVGLLLRRERVSQRRIWLCSALIVGFLGGGALGALAFSMEGFYSLCGPAILVVVLAIIVLIMLPGKVR